MAEHAAREAQTQRIGVSRAERGGAAKESGSGPAAELLIGLQRTAGNRAVAGLVSAGAAIQRQLIIGGPPPVTQDWINQPVLQRIIAYEATAAIVPPDAVRQRLVAMIGAGLHVHDTEHEAVRAATQEVAWEALKTRPDVEVVYRTPPLTEADAQTVISNVERADPNAFQGLQKQGGVFRPELPPREHEWGILKARTRDECVLIIGAQKTVSWGQELLYCGIGIAHSHPYFPKGPARHAPKPVRRPALCRPSPRRSPTI